MHEQYIIAKEGSMWIILFNSSFGAWKELDDLAQKLAEEGVEPREISNPEAFDSQGIDYEAVYNKVASRVQKETEG